MPPWGLPRSSAKHHHQGDVDRGDQLPAGARIEGRKALAAHDTAKLKRREERLATALDAAVDYYAYSKELFEAWSDADEHGGESQGTSANGSSCGSKSLLPQLSALPKWLSTWAFIT